MTQTCPKGCCLIEFSEDSPATHHLRRGYCQKAGVFIYDPDQDRVLLVQSRGYLWGPPKGTVELAIQETSAQCAIRETREETGLTLSTDEFQRAINVKNRAIYYYVERPTCPVHIQKDVPDNDVNGITWIRLACLEECIADGNIVLNGHCRVVFKRFMGRDFPPSEFIRVQSSRKPK